MLLCWVAVSPAWAQTPPAEVTQLRFERDGDAILLSATVSFELPAAVEEALVKGIPMIFVAELDLFRERWYWTNKKVVSVKRHMRLAYQPLTRRWRLHVAYGPLAAAGLGVALNQSFETLPDAIASMQRLAGWRIADVSEIDLEQSHLAEFRFKLDHSQLPRPFQIGSLGQSDWTVSAAVTRRFVLEPPK